ncbi:MAG: ATP-binding protein [Pseudomonadales bacterium]
MFEEFAIGNHFCGRREEIVRITRLAQDGKNILLYAKRRYGKSSLIKQVYKTTLKDKKSFMTVYVDLFEVIDEMDFAKLFYQATADAMPFTTAQALKKLLRYFSKVRFSAGIDGSGSITYLPTLAARDFEELIKDAFDGISRYAQEEKVTVVIALDEFQQIAEVKAKKIDAILRKYMQSQKNVSYIFSGSKKHLLTNLFNHQNKPLYNMATGIELKGIDVKTFYSFVNKGLNKRLTPVAFDYLYELSDGESKLIQQACYHLYYLDDELLTEHEVDQVITRIVKEADGECRIIYSRLTSPQKTAMKAVSQFAGKNLFSQSNLNLLGTSKQSLLTALKALIRDELVDKDNMTYFITDRKLELWFRQAMRAMN